MTATLLALTGCAAQHRPAGELAVAPAPRPVVRIEVTNQYARSIDVYYGFGGGYLGTLAPGAHGSYTVPPATGRLPVYARWTGSSEVAFNISNARRVRYVYEDAAAK